MRAILVYVILCFWVIGNTFCQDVSNDLTNQIDFRITKSLSDCSNSDTLFSHGETFFYKKYLGLIRIRTGKGDTYRSIILCDSNLISESISSIEFKENRSNQSISNYYYANNELIKYENYVIWRNTINSKDSLMHKVVLYFTNKEIINKVLEINDRYKFDQNKIDWILLNSDKTIFEIRKINKPSS